MDESSQSIASKKKRKKKKAKKKSRTSDQEQQNVTAAEQAEQEQQSIQVENDIGMGQQLMNNDDLSAISDTDQVKSAQSLSQIVARIVILRWTTVGATELACGAAKVWALQIVGVLFLADWE